MTKITELTLDLDKWICGDPDDCQSKRGYTRGSGGTWLLNEKGYMCCLGQFAKQMGIPNDRLLNVYHPSDILPSVSKEENEVIKEYRSMFGNEKDFIRVNDNPDMPIEEKINSIRKLLKAKGITLKIKSRKR